MKEYLINNNHERNYYFYSFDKNSKFELLYSVVFYVIITLENDMNVLIKSF